MIMGESGNLVNTFMGQPLPDWEFGAVLSKAGYPARVLFLGWSIERTMAAGQPAFHAMKLDGLTLGRVVTRVGIDWVTVAVIKEGGAL